MSESPMETCKDIISCLRSNPQKALVYNVVAQILDQGQIPQGIELLNDCCNQITDGGRKFPAKEVAKVMHTALFLNPSIKEKPIRVLSDQDLKISTEVCLLYLVLNTEFQKKRKQLFPLIESAILKKGINAWENMSESDRDYLTIFFQKAFEKIDTKQISEVSKASFNVPKELLVTNNLESEHALNKGDSEYSMQRRSEDTLSKKHQKQIEPTSHLNKITPFPSRTEKPETFPSNFDAISSARYLLAWVMDRKDHMEQIETHNKAMDEENEKLKKQIRELVSENKKLSQNNVELNKKMEEKASEITSMKTKYDKHIQETKDKMNTFAQESEEREQRLIREAKNRLMSDLKIFVQDFLSLNSKEDSSDKARMQGKLFKNAINTLTMHGIRFEK